MVQPNPVHLVQEWRTINKTSFVPRLGWKRGGALDSGQNMLVERHSEGDERTDDLNESSNNKRRKNERFNENRF